MKTKQLLLLSLLSLASFAPHVLAQGFVPLAPIPGLTDISPTSIIDPNTLATFFNNLYKYLIGLAATLAVIEIIWGGLQYATTESIGNKEEGKNRIRQAIFGLVLVLSPVLVFSIINPSILNLSLNLPPINLNTPPAPVTTLPPCITGNSVNCTPQAPLNEAATTATLPTCGPNVSGSCVPAAAPACSPGQYCYTTTDASSVGGIVCSSSSSACTSLYTAASKGGYGSITVTSGCSLCPK